MRIQPRSTCSICGGLQRLLRRGDQVHLLTGKDCIAGLGCLQRAVFELLQHGIGNANVVAPQNRQRIGAGARIRHGWPAGDDGRVVARHVADGQRHHLGGRTCGGQPPALDAREMLAHAIHLGNVGATGQQGLVHGLLVGQRQPFGGQRQQSRSAA
ncbi:hypothetical protein SDC9_191450 [bioreactor metagenome]|uniref:Uncharacterized protein n=1 Tax=bioreactor metagenome TaxID=1076179 RepID=A0A645I0C2_9ZZZZ